MTLRYTVLASGSGGNASLIQSGGFGVLLDGGLGAKDLTARLAEAGHAADCVQAMLLTHTHTDHWNDTVFTWLSRRKVPLYCHPGHHATLARYARGFPKLLAAGLVRAYAAHEEFVPAP